MGCVILTIFPMPSHVAMGVQLGCRTHNKAPATILPGGELISELPAQISVASRPQWGDHEVAWSLWSPFRSTAGSVSSTAANCRAQDRWTALGRALGVIKPVYFTCSQVPTASVEPHAKVNRTGSFQVRI